MNTSSANRSLPMSNLEIVELQAQIIDLQNKAINELYLLLAQHMEVDDIDGCDPMRSAERAIALQEELRSGRRTSP